MQPYRSLDTALLQYVSIQWGRLPTVLVLPVDNINRGSTKMKNPGHDNSTSPPTPIPSKLEKEIKNVNS